MKVIQPDRTVRDEVLLTGSIPTGANLIGATTIKSSAGAEVTMSPGFGTSDIQSGANAAIAVSNYGLIFNGLTWDRVRSNTLGTLLANSARSATVSTADQTNYNGKGLRIYLNVTSAGTGSITLSIEEKDPISGIYTSILTGAIVIANGQIIYKVYAGLTAVANSIANDFIPRTWRVTVTHNNANPITYSVAYALNL